MIKDIVNWIKTYAKENKRKTLVVGISGGIDSAVVSTLCAMTKMKTIVVSMPIEQIEEQHDLSIDHGEWLEQKFSKILKYAQNVPLPKPWFGLIYSLCPTWRPQHPRPLRKQGPTACSAPPTYARELVPLGR